MLSKCDKLVEKYEPTPLTSFGNFKRALKHSAKRSDYGDGSKSKHPENSKSKDDSRTAEKPRNHTLYDFAQEFDSELNINSVLWGSHIDELDIESLELSIDQLKQELVRLEKSKSKDAFQKIKRM